MRGVVLPAIALTLIYALVIAGLIFLLRVLRVTRRWAIVLGFLAYGLASGLLAAWAWPYDSCTLPNFYATLLGDAVYGRWAGRLRDAGLLGVPQVYLVASVTLTGLAGLIVQWVDARVRARGGCSLRP